ncbi:hypothetical protein VF14_26760 [Nostoc linckia z18]|uniref:Uncharacterized protein n=1 Tax=Nostoc linckia z7 TaxID=1628745 RepID=A0ABX4KN33_NOSLI|nr:hypothetical protein VF02_27290 [Nostoc linckia z1]PHJ62991.1 hypothetical protein VF05_25640 [Nostoc linckia z3]PHJ71940.1 hypothetical protein VF03_19350 [Nostoc linckia z2]PHJ77598.1 hypothetical protein VF06_29940 [Nostoc linckia z4]PHJ85918.1 hypothetical protein VF07_22935 [Nostoc linckia z6]PHJ95934.1 hypothetical protein VF04_17560 [Nostoc linckia z7]PHK04034.1 hypothetical protein VF09_29065 [Nostoc linckia z9]PHK30764.1 hypothetical protein VF14_26760 [Nostoc linckia z18]
MGRWGDGKMGRWGDGEMGSVGSVGSVGGKIFSPSSHTSHTSCLPNAQCPMPHAQFPLLQINNCSCLL